MWQFAQILRLVAVLSVVLIFSVTLWINFPPKWNAASQHSWQSGSELKEIKAMISNLQERLESSENGAEQNPDQMLCAVCEKCEACEECEEPIECSEDEELRGRIDDLTRQNVEMQRKLAMAKVSWDDCLTMKYRKDCTDYRRDDPSQIPCIVELLYDLIVATDAGLLHGGITHWMAFGSLLGAKRNSSVIPWTDDADFMYTTTHTKNGKPIIDDVIRASREDLYNRGFLIFPHDRSDQAHYGKVCVAKHNKKYMQFIEPFNFSEVLYYKKPYPYVDVFPGVFDDKYFRAEIFSCSFTKQSVLPLGKIRLYDHDITAPGDIHRYLIQNFGPTYMTPLDHKAGHGAKQDECQPKWKQLI